jgi:hypothetical protein
MAVSMPLSTSGMQIAAGALPGLAVLAWWWGMPLLRRTPLDGVLGLAAIVFAISTLASGHPLQAGGWARLWVVIGYFGVYWWLEDEHAVLRFVRWLLIAAAVSALYGVVQHYTGIDWYRELLGRRHFVRPRIAGAQGFAAVGFFRNYLTYAHVMLIPLGFALVSPQRWTRLIVVPLIALGLLLSTARGAWVGAAAMGAVLVVARRGGAARLAGLVAIVVLLGLLSPGFREQIVPALTQAETNTGRLAIYAANLDIVQDHPILGLGFGRYQRVARPYYDRHPDADRRSHAHNNFLQIAAEAGLVGLAAFVLVFATALRFGGEVVRGGHSEAVRLTALGACLAIVGFLVGGLTQYSFGDTEVATGLWATLALLMRLRDAV